MSYQISNKGINLICDAEGFVPHPYKDQIGRWTIGYGTTFYPGGKNVAYGDPAISKEQAIQYLTAYVNAHAIPTINQYITVPLNQNQVDSLCSFIYNLGPGPLVTGHITYVINNHGACDAVQAEFKKWVYAAHHVLPDLVKRRQKEASLYCS
jgi:lysozyme